MSATDRLRFLEIVGGDRGRNVSFIVGGGSRVKGNVAVLLLEQQIPKCRIEVNGVCSVPARVILRCPTSCTVFGECSRADNLAFSCGKIVDGERVVWVAGAGRGHGEDVDATKAAQVNRRGLAWLSGWHLPVSS
jgi:hypothetical protein